MSEVRFGEPERITITNREGGDGGGGGADHYNRYIYPHMWQIGSDALYVPNHVHYIPIDVDETMTIDGVVMFNGAVAGANDVYVGFYDSLNEAPVNRLAVSVTTVLAGINQKQLVPFTASVQVDEGYYFLAWEPEDAADSWYRGAAGNAMCAPAGIADGPAIYSEDMGAYLQPPAIATPVNRTSVIYLPALIARVVSVP